MNHRWDPPGFDTFDGESDSAAGCDGIFEKVSSQQLVGFLLSHIRHFAPWIP